MREMIEEKARRIPIAASCDVCVLGAGPAGVSAAITAAREGAKTILVEQGGDAGGMATAGLMSHWTGKTEGGIYEEILERSADWKEGGDHPFNGGNRQIINPERLKTVLLEMLMEAGAELRLYTLASMPIMDRDRVTGVIVESKSGREAILAKVTIDATGDGDIAARAGVPYVKGREEDGLMQPASLMFKVGGVDMERGVFPGCFEETVRVPKGDIQQLGRHCLPSPAGHVLLYKTTLPGVVTVNMTNCTGIDGTDSRDLTRAVVVCRRQMEEIVKFLREYVPGFEECYLLSSASLAGIRETRHFRGEAVITAQDIEEARVFDDWVVARASFNFDVHNMTGTGMDATGRQKAFRQEKSYTIPYGCFVPVKVDGLFLAGRDISGTHMAHSSYRAMPVCANMGNAVGVAAALCVKKKVEPRELDGKEVQKRLMELGICL